MAQNGIDYLLSQHQEIQTLLDAVDRGPADAKQQNFDRLRELLAVHETAEELILRPVTKKSVPNGEEIADARFAEENHSKEALAELEKLDVGSAELTEKFATFKQDVLEHAQNEET